MPNAYFAWSIDNDGKPCLSHHGIKGQKWGVITKEYEPVGRSRITSQRSQTRAYKVAQKQKKSSDKEKTNNGRKWLIGLGLIVAGAAGYAMYKTGKIKKEYVSQLREKALDESEWAKRYREKSIYKYKPYSESSARMKEVAKRFEERAKKYTELANKASRRIAVKNWIKNKGRIRIKEVS